MVQNVVTTKPDWATCHLSSHLPTLYPQVIIDNMGCPEGRKQVVRKHHKTAPYAPAKKGAGQAVGAIQQASIG